MDELIRMAVGGAGTGVGLGVVVLLLLRFTIPRILDDSADARRVFAVRMQQRDESCAKTETEQRSAFLTALREQRAEDAEERAADRQERHEASRAMVEALARLEVTLPAAVARAVEGVCPVRTREAGRE